MEKVDPKQPIGEAFAQMPDDHAQSREAVKDTTENNPQKMQACFDGESVDGPLESPLGKRRVHSGGRRAWVQVDGNIKRFCGREDIQEFRVVEIFAVRVGVDDGTLQPQ